MIKVKRVITKKGKKVYEAIATQRQICAIGKTKRKALRKLAWKLDFIGFKELIKNKVKKFLRIK